MTARRTTSPSTTATTPKATTQPKATRRGRQANVPTKEVTPNLAALAAAAKAVAQAGNVKGTKEKAVAVKQDARRQLATILVNAYAEAFAAIPADSPIFAALGREDAAQYAANWVHHLPVIREQWSPSLPTPKRSNWEG